MGRSLKPDETKPADSAPLREPLAQVVEYTQDVDSFGWSILVLFHARYGFQSRRWGVLQILAGTESGEGFPTEKGSPRTQLEVVQEGWNMIDWYKTEDEARAAFKEAQSRVW